MKQVSAIIGSTGRWHPTNSEPYNVYHNQRGKGWPSIGKGLGGGKRGKGNDDNDGPCGSFHKISETPQTSENKTNVVLGANLSAGNSKGKGKGKGKGPDSDSGPPP